jgi:hypothetical protein
VIFKQQANKTYKTKRLTSVTAQKVETILLLETCVGRATGAARDVLADVVTHDVLDLFRLKSTFDLCSKQTRCCARVDWMRKQMKNRFVFSQHKTYV